MLLKRLSDTVTRPAKPDKTNRKIRGWWTSGAMSAEEAAGSNSVRAVKTRSPGAKMAIYGCPSILKYSKKRFWLIPIWVCQIPCSWFVPNWFKLCTPNSSQVYHQMSSVSPLKCWQTQLYDGIPHFYFISGQTQMCDDQVIFAHPYSCTARIVVVTCCYESYLIIWPFSAWFYWIQWNILKWQKWLCFFSHVVHQKRGETRRSKS